MTVIVNRRIEVVCLAASSADDGLSCFNWRSHWSSIRIGALCLGLLMLPGCFGEAGGAPCYPVHGTVKFNGDPLPEGMIVFHPLDAAAGGHPQPVGYTDGQGHFTLTSSQPNDGAPAGRYAITVEFREQQLSGDELVHDGPNLLPEKYSRPESSGLDYVVHEGDNEVPTLELREEGEGESP